MALFMVPPETIWPSSVSRNLFQRQSTILFLMHFVNTIRRQRWRLRTSPAAQGHAPQTSSASADTYRRRKSCTSPCRPFPTRYSIVNSTNSTSNSKNNCLALASLITGQLQGRLCFGPTEDTQVVVMVEEKGIVPVDLSRKFHDGAWPSIVMEAGYSETERAAFGHEMAVLCV